MTDFQQHVFNLTCDHYRTCQRKLTPAMSASIDRRLDEIDHGEGPECTTDELITLLNYVCPPGMYYGEPWGGGEPGFYNLDDYERNYKRVRGQLTKAEVTC